MHPPNENGAVNICITYEHQLFTNELTFFKEIQWPCLVKVVGETGKIELQFKKSVGGVWENFGVLKQQSRGLLQFAIDAKFQYRMISKMPVSHNTSLMKFERVDGSRIVVPIGKHVRVFGTIKGIDVNRCKIYLFIFSDSFHAIKMKCIRTTL